MAANRPTTARRNMNSARNPRGVYIDGSAARKLQEVPERRYYPPAQRPARQPAKVAASPRTQERQRTLSKEAKKNRAKAMSMNRKFVVFIVLLYQLSEAEVRLYKEDQSGGISGIRTGSVERG